MGDPKLTRRFTRPSLTSKPGEAPPALLLRIDAEHESSASCSWLCGPGLPPVSLAHPLITFGRHADCAIILPHVSISRRHAAIKTRGKVIVFEDSGSRNGSVLNGNRVAKPQVLRPNDRILLGPYLFEVRTDPKAQSPSRRVPALTGSLEDRALTEVIQGIDFRRKTCTLKVQSGEILGFLTVRDGEPLEAAWGTRVNDEALIAMLSLSHGKFALMSSAPDVKPAFKASLRTLLFTALKRLDEGQGSMDTQKF
jgi:pSer/pThr/pTyr-binding forkhead associated (FHA) protein